MNYITQKNQGNTKEEKEIEMPDQPAPPQVPNPSASQTSKQQGKDEDCAACAEGPNDEAAVATQNQENELEDDVYPEPQPRARGEGIIKSKPRAKRRH